MTTTTICGTDVHILKGEYPVQRGLTIGHEPVGVIEELGSAVSGYQPAGRRAESGDCSLSRLTVVKIWNQHERAGDLTDAQAVQGGIGFFQRHRSDLGAHGNLRGQRHEFGAIATG
jgi:hypothetical protein